MTYWNNFDENIETEYMFPISVKSIFHHFEATFEDGTTIVGIIKEKQQARQEYEDAINSGKQAAYSKINKDSADIMLINVGNIKPNETIQIKLSFL
jgi:hypothetical protein